MRGKMYAEKCKRSFKLVRMIGETINESIKLTIDVPSNHEDGKVPILDLKVWIEQVETTEGPKVMILHEHYMKEVSSKFLIHKDASLLWGTITNKSNSTVTNRYINIYL